MYLLCLCPRCDGWAIDPREGLFELDGERVCQGCFDAHQQLYPAFNFLHERPDGSYEGASLRMNEDRETVTLKPTHIPPKEGFVLHKAGLLRLAALVMHMVAAMEDE